MANFPCCKWPKIEKNNLAILSQCDQVKFSSQSKIQISDETIQKDFKKVSVRESENLFFNLIELIVFKLLLGFEQFRLNELQRGVCQCDRIGRFVAVWASFESHTFSNYLGNLVKLVMRCLECSHPLTSRRGLESWCSRSRSGDKK